MDLLINYLLMIYKLNFKKCTENRYVKRINISIYSSKIKDQKLRTIKILFHLVEIYIVEQLSVFLKKLFKNV